MVSLYYKVYYIYLCKYFGVVKVVNIARAAPRNAWCCVKAPLFMMARVVTEGGSWPRLWDTTMHLGSQHTKGLQAVSRIMAHHSHGIKPCPLCDEKDFGEESPLDHFLSKHRTDLGLDSKLASADDLLNLIVKNDVYFAYKFQKLFHGSQ